MISENNLPQLNGHNMTCGGGFETWMQYVDGFELRHFCAFELIDDERGLVCLTEIRSHPGSVVQTKTPTCCCDHICSAVPIWPSLQSKAECECKTTERTAR
jgi:hypothetical protein